MPKSDGHYKVVTVHCSGLGICSDGCIEEKLNQMREKGWKFVSIALEYNSTMRSGAREGLRSFIAVFEKMNA